MNDIKECERCGRKLKSEKSKKAGFGPVCLRKHEAEELEQEAALNSISTRFPPKD